MPITELDLPAFRPQAFNATAPGTMQPRPRDPNAPMPYGEQMGNVGQAIMNGLGGAARFIFGVPGAGSLQERAVTAATQPAVTPPPPAGAMASAGPLTSGGPDRVGGAQAMPAAAKVDAPAAAAPRSRKSGAAPAAAPAAGALVPGETGFYMGDQLVPYGTKFNMSGDGSYSQVGAGGAGGGGAGGGGAGGLIDPRNYFPDVVGQQMRYARMAADDILKNAGSGDQLGYSARLRALSAVYLNGLAGVGQGGANSFNNSAASVMNQNTAAQTSRYTSDNSLKGDLARSAAQRYGAELGYESHMDANQVAREGQILTAETPVPIGQSMVPGIGGIPTPVTTYGMRSRNGGMPTPVDNKAKPQVGKEYTDGKGNRAVYNADGSWTAVK